MLALLSLAAVRGRPAAAESFRELQATLAAGRRVLDLTDRVPRIVDPAHPLPAPVAPFTIELEDVRARYGPDERPALDGFSLRLEPGARVALLGPSGAGKTTVASLLLRFIDPERGRVTLAGEDLRCYRQEDVRARDRRRRPGRAPVLGEHPRQRQARPAGGDRRRPRASAALGPHPRTGSQSLPDGLDTLVGEEGRELSGGQRQRIVLARALLTDAPVLVLDEPTAHLDPPTAKRLVEDVFAAAAAARCC